MSSLRRVVGQALLPLWMASASTIARAQEPPRAAGDAPVSVDTGAGSARDASEDTFGDAFGNTFDDPKLARRLGAPVEVAPPPSPGAPEAVAPGGEGVDGETVAPVRGARTPRLKLAYRRFAFAEIGAAARPAQGASEPFDVVSLDFYPISSFWRFGLSTQYGWQEGTFRQNGDAFIAESVSLGWQIPGPALTPFLEAYGGGGLLQRPKSGLGLNSIATAYGQLGVDVGTEVFLARYFCLSFAVGYIHATDLFGRNNAVDSFSVDTWSFKVGMGL